MDRPQPRLGAGWYSLGRLVTRLLRLAFAVQLVTVGISVWGIATFGPWVGQPEAFDIDAVRQYDDAKRALQVVGWSTDAAAGLVLSTWLFRAHRSDRVSSEWTEHSALWCYLGWVVPPLNAFMPYGIVRDVRRGAEGREIARWPALGWWWLTLLAGIGVSFVSSAVYLQVADGLDPRQYASSYEGGAWLDVISGSLLLVSLVLLLLVVRTLTRSITASPFGNAATGTPAVASHP